MADNSIKTEILIHDLKVPVSVIDAGAKSLLNRQERYGPLTEKQVKVLKRIIRNTLTTQRLVNDMLELGRSREGVIHLTQFPLGELVSGVLTEVFDLSNPPLAEQVRNVQNYDDLTNMLATHGFIVVVAEAAWKTRVCLDKAKVSQILRNLITNALKHRNQVVEIEAALEEAQVIFRVKDDGRGIPAANHQKIFETYFTTGGCLENAINSHGLGLAGVMVLVKDMGGHLTLESVEGDGARFTVVLPL